MKLTQVTDFPWEGKVRITVEPEAEATIDLRLRIPAWAIGQPVPGDLYRFAKAEAAAVSLKINGEAVDATPGDDGYVPLKRTWKPGDLVELDLPMPVRRVHAHPKMEGNQGKVALMRGPVVYCFEGIDHPETNLFKLSLPQDSSLSVSHRPDLLGGIRVIQGRGLDENQGPVELTAIPYFAWANRSKSPMNLWISETIPGGE